MAAEARLVRKVERIVARHATQQAIDAEVNDTLDMNEVLTLALLPVTSKLRTYVVGCLVRDTERARHAKASKRLRDEQERSERDLVPVEVQGGGKCKITVFMTKDALARERGRCD